METGEEKYDEDVLGITNKNNIPARELMFINVEGN
jgi:hypothetical protein